MSPVITVLEARIPPQRAADLQTAYVQAVAEPLPTGLVRSSFQRGVTDPPQWRIETIWRLSVAIFELVTQLDPSRGETS